MELKLSPRISIKFWQTTWRIIPEYSNLQGQRHYILKNHMKTLFPNCYVVEAGGKSNIPRFKGHKLRSNYISSYKCRAFNNHVKNVT